jgi:hypothetical protein
MKKYLFVIVAVIFSLGLSAFALKSKDKINTENQTTYYWFQVSTGQGDDATLDNSQVSSYIGSGTSVPGSGYTCSGSGHNCVVGFIESQVDLMAFPIALKTGPQTIQTVGVQRNTQ